MKFLRQLLFLLSRWIDDACLAILLIGGLTRPRRKFEVVEQEHFAFLVRVLRRRSAPRSLGSSLRFVEGQFVEDTGAQVRSRLERGQIEIVLARRRFVFRSLELPQQASGFLDAIVRSQIDRLTPWTPSQAAFGCSEPAETSGGRIGVVVAATSRSSVMPFVTALESLKPSSIIVSVASDEADEAPRRTIVFSQHENQRIFDAACS